MPDTAFLMIVTPRDYSIARYAIPPLARLVQSSPNLQACIYCNGLSAQEVQSISELVEALDRVVVRDNSEYLQSVREDMEIGKFRTENGSTEVRQGFFETAPEVWSRELTQLKADFVTIIDPDFEILTEEFVHAMLREVARESELAFYSVYYAPETRMFESYAGEDAIIAERWHTCFCVYRRAALCKYHDFSYFEERKDGLPFKYDHSAMLQKILRERHAYTGRSLNSQHYTQFVHYGAFAQNQSLTGCWLGLYRIICIAMHNGWNHKVHWGPITRAIRFGARSVWRVLRLGRFDAERARYAYECDSR